MDIVDDMRYGYIDDDGLDPTVDDMDNFLCICQELCHKWKTLTLFRPVNSAIVISLRQGLV